MRRIYFMLLVLVVPVLGLAGCGGTQQESPKAGGALRVTATTGMVADIARQVGGNHVEVTALMGPGVDPHLYKPSQKDLQALSGADVVLYNGLHLEGRLADVLVKMAHRVRTEAVGAAVPEELLLEPEEFEGHFDPHVWFDVSLWRHAVAHVRDVFGELRPEHKPEFEINAALYLADLDALHEYAKGRMAEIPEQQRVLVTAHDAFGYFGRAYGLEVMGLQGISTATEFGLRDLEQLVDMVVSQGIKAVFVESSVATKSIEALIAGARARGHEVKLGGELFSDAMGGEDTVAGTYVGMFRHNVDTIAEALK